MSKSITLLTPVFNEEGCIDAYIESCQEVFKELHHYHFSILFIDDGSSDLSWAKIEALSQQNEYIKGIKLSRNFGAHAAISTGLSNVQSDATLILPCDLQDPPENLPRFIEQWEQGFKIVWGKRSRRKDPLINKFYSRIFNWLLSISDFPKESYIFTGSYIFMDRSAISSFSELQERNRATFALVAWLGYPQSFIEYERQQRFSGHSGWNFGKMIKTSCDCIIGFSFIPRRLIIYSGFILFLISILFASYTLVNWYFTSTIQGWTSLAFITSVFFGILFLYIGILCEYLYRIYIESVRRPISIIEKSTDHPS